MRGASNHHGTHSLLPFHLAGDALPSVPKFTANCITYGPRKGAGGGVFDEMLLLNMFPCEVVMVALWALESSGSGPKRVPGRS